MHCNAMETRTLKRENAVKSDGRAQAQPRVQPEFVGFNPELPADRRSTALLATTFPGTMAEMARC